jgi:endonuclease/exonuclease/phosphatase family metal-dependent hydrolase
MFKKISILQFLLLLLNSIAIILLVFSYGAYHISPITLPLLAIAGLAYPYILLANLLFLVIWLIVRIKFAIVPLVFILLGWNHIGHLVQFGGNEMPEDSSGQIKLLCYNLQNFLKLNTSSTKYVTDFSNESDILDFLQNENADIVCLQEMLNDRRDKEEFVQEMAELLRCPGYYYENYYTKNPNKVDAVATFTRYPIVSEGHLTYEEKTIGIYTDLTIQNDTVRVYNLHLASIHFREEDYQFWSEIGQGSEQEKLTEGTSKILQKMKIAFRKRAGQVKVLEQHFLQCPYPVILCGDFNDTPLSYAYNRLSKGKTDAFVAGGSGLGSTYAGDFFPSFRIDFILYSQSFRSAGFERHKVPFSDHYPITTYLYSE